MTNAIRKKRFNLAIPIKLYGRLEKCAEHQEMTVTEMIRQFIRVGVKTVENEEKGENLLLEKLYE